MRLKPLIFTLLITVPLMADNDIYEQSMEDILSMDSEVKVDIGSRDGARNYLRSNTPIDVITHKQIDSSGLNSLVDVLRYFVAGFNAPQTSVADGSDHVQSFTIRGMNPDQILFLINGKRVHTSALLHVNGVIGRGSSHVDLDTIALRSIERIEIMRDGASAQYGSDAISGVVNIILKGMGHKSIVTTQYGKYSAGDGEKIQADVFVSIPLDYDGFFNITMDAKSQEATQRAGLDKRVDIPRVTTHVGIPESKSYKAMLNTELVQAENFNIYSNAFINHRDSEASAFYRPSNSDTIKNEGLVHDGFLPIINAEILDYAFVVGVKGELLDSVSWDFSNSYGRSNFHYYVNNSMNYTLGESSPTSFDNGELEFIQNTTNFDLRKSTSRLKVAGGLEFRQEKYKINAGEFSSYSGTGSQGFAGFSDENEVDASRYSYAIYLDSIYNLTQNLTLEILARYEEYSDFGESTNAKIAFAYDITPNILLRSSGSTGFRAPSLAQSNYSQTSSFVNSATGGLSTQGTFRTDHEVSEILGATDLRSERSKNISFGGVYQPTKQLSFMVDYFYIEVNDKIVLTNELSGNSDEEKAVLAKYNVSEARFFTNAVDTVTQGVDIRVEYLQLLEDNSKLDFSLWFNYSKNKIKNAMAYTDNMVERVRIENGQPKSSLRFLTNYEVNKINIALNISGYGKYSQMIDNVSYDFKKEVTADLDMSYSIANDSKISIGGTNIFDNVPNKWDGLEGDYYAEDGIKPYSRYSPFGYSGAYYYVKASMEF